MAKRSERGFIIVLVLIALMAMSFFLITGVTTTTSTIKVSGNYSKTLDVFNIAEVGIAKARPIIEGYSDFNALFAAYPSLTIIPTTSWGSGSYSVTIKNNNGPSSCGGTPDCGCTGGSSTHDCDNIIMVTSSGRTAQGGKVDIETYLQMTTATVTFPGNPSDGSASGSAAGLLCGTTTDVQMKGSSHIDGRDYQAPNNIVPCNGTSCDMILNGTGGTGYAVASQGVTNTDTQGSASYVSAAPSPTLQNTGSGSNCSQWQTLYNQYAALTSSAPNVVVLTGSESNNADLSECTTPKVFIINTTASSYKFKGQTNLCGVLIIASNTEIETTGTVTIVGLVLDMGNYASLSFSSSSGRALVYGQIITNSTAVDVQKEISLTGTSEIRYSSQGLGYAATALASTGGGGGGGSTPPLLTIAWEEKY